jgi:hypothetical protein
VDADQKDIGRLYANRPRSRLLDDPVVFNVVGTIGLILFISVLWHPRPRATTMRPMRGSLCRAMRVKGTPIPVGAIPFMEYRRGT